MDKLAENDEDDMETCKIKRLSPPNLRRRKTWPRLVPCISDIIYWEDGDATEIGEGFYSKVYKFEHEPSGCTVVVKVAKDHVSCMEHTDQAVMLKEIKLLKKLSHDNIIRYLGLCAKDGKFYPVLEFINGGGLDRLLVNFDIAISWSEKIGFCRDVANGMQYLHSNKIFHRDLKSTNCLIRLGEGGIRTVVVADFGLAREVAGDTRTPRKMSTVGTAFWMAPELLCGKLYNSKVDVFSYGILACEILARVISDPDDLPRTSNFGIDLDKFTAMCPDCPRQLLALVKECTEVNNPFSRPSFEEILITLDEIETPDDNCEVTDDIMVEEEEDSSLVTSQCSCENEVFKQESSGLSDDSGFGECNMQNAKFSETFRTDNINNNNLKTNVRDKTKRLNFIQKKVTFRFVTSLLSGQRCRFNNDVTHEGIAPSRDISLRRSTSLPDLKTDVKDFKKGMRERSRTLNSAAQRPKSMFYKKDEYSS